MVANLRFGGRGVDRFRQLIGFLQSLRKTDAAHSAVLLIAGPAASRNIAPHDTFNRKHIQFAAHHTVAVKLFLPEKFRHILYVSRDHMVGKNVLGHVKPEFGHLGQNGSLFGHIVIQDHIETADPVCGHHNQTVSVVINLSYFAFLDWLHFLHSSHLICSV